MLHRLGAAASLTLGNRKSVDIFIVQPEGSMLTLDVKDLAGPYEWPTNTICLPAPPSHFVWVAFVVKQVEACHPRCIIFISPIYS